MATLRSTLDHDCVSWVARLKDARPRLQPTPLAVFLCGRAFPGCRGRAVLAQAVEVQPDMRRLRRGIRKRNGLVVGFARLFEAPELLQEGSAHAVEVEVPAELRFEWLDHRERFGRS